MAKYSFALKLKIVTAYMNNEGGYKYLAKKYGVKNAAQIERWVSAFKNFGFKGLYRKRNHATYTSEFKLSVVESYLISELSYQQIASYYGLHDSTLIARWVSEFRNDGIDAFAMRVKGRTPSMEQADTKKNKQVQEKQRTKRNKKELTPDQLRILELEKQLLYARIENAYLKELRRLRLEDARKMKEQQESLVVSEENSN